jgi:serine/threonine protein kinase
VGVRACVADFKAETKMLVSLRHPNIVLFMGACFDHTNLAIVTEWMPKGSLHSVLHDARIPLDFSIRMRMLRDIACGMGTHTVCMRVRLSGHSLAV